MAKTKPRSITARRGVHFRKVSSHVDVARMPRTSRGVGPFIACAKIGSAERGVKRLAACAYGRNPRKAIAAALRKAASSTARRSGAFAGLGRR